MTEMIVKEEIFTLSHFLMNQFLSDTILINKESQKEYFCHKVLLAYNSKYFYYKLLSHDKQPNLEIKENKVVIEIPPTGESRMNQPQTDNVIPIILKFLYSNQNINSIVNDLNQNNCFYLLSYSHSLGIKSLHDFIGEFIANKVLNDENCAKVYAEGLLFESDSIKNAALDSLNRNFSKIYKNFEEFKNILNLPLDLMKKLLESNDISIDNEKQICDIVINYIKIRRNINQENSSDIKKEEQKDPQSEIKSEENKTEEKKEDKQVEEKKDENQGEVKNDGVDGIQGGATSLIEKDINFAEDIQKKIQELKDSFTIKLLKPEEERSLIEKIRFSYLSHSDLLGLSSEPIFTNHMDLIIEGISLRLNPYENVEKKDFKICLDKRNYLEEPKNERKSKIFEETKNFNPLASYDDKKNSKIEPSKSIKGSQNFLTNTMPNLNPRPPQSFMLESKQNFLQLSNPAYNLQNLEFTYEYDFDENGALYYLGTLGKTTFWRNPNDIGQVKVFCSSLGKGKLSDFVGRELVNLRSINEPFSYFGIDFGEDRAIIPSAYSIRNRNTSSHVMLCWQLEGSNDKVNFEVLDTRVYVHSDPKINAQIEKERNALKSPGCTSTWGVETSIKSKFPNGFRFLILKQISKNSSGAYNIALSGFEVYGKCVGRRWGFQ